MPETYVTYVPPPESSSKLKLGLLILFIIIGIIVGVVLYFVLRKKKSSVTRPPTGSESSPSSPNRASGLATPDPSATSPGRGIALYTDVFNAQVDGNWTKQTCNDGYYAFEGGQYSKGDVNCGSACTGLPNFTDADCNCACIAKADIPANARFAKMTSIQGDTLMNPDGTTVYIGPPLPSGPPPASGKYPLGMTCSSHWDCQSHYCNGTCKKPTPTPDRSKKESNAKCTTNSECQSNFCMKCGAGCQYDNTCQTEEVMQAYALSRMR